MELPSKKRKANEEVYTLILFYFTDPFHWWPPLDSLSLNPALILFSKSSCSGEQKALQGKKLIQNGGRKCQLYNIGEW